MSNKVNSCSIPEGDIVYMCNVVGETESSRGCPKKKLFFELRDMALIMGVCLNPLYRPAHMAGLQAPLIKAISSDSESTFLWDTVFKDLF